MTSTGKQHAQTLEYYVQLCGPDCNPYYRSIDTDPDPTSMLMPIRILPKVLHRIEPKTYEYLGAGRRINHFATQHPYLICTTPLFATPQLCCATLHPTQLLYTTPIITFLALLQVGRTLYIQSSTTF
jgi:hypothetical protein